MPRVPPRPEHAHAPTLAPAPRPPPSSLPQEADPRLAEGCSRPSALLSAAARVTAPPAGPCARLRCGEQPSHLVSGCRRNFAPGQRAAASGRAERTRAPGYFSQSGRPKAVSLGDPAALGQGWDGGWGLSLVPECPSAQTEGCSHREDSLSCRLPDPGLLSRAGLRLPGNLGEVGVQIGVRGAL